MTNNIQKYTTYKPSGVEWLGDIPEHWEVKKVTHIFNKIGSGTTPTAGTPKYYDNGYINWLQTGDLTDGLIEQTSKKLTNKALSNFSTLKTYPKKSLVIAMYGATIGKVGYLGIETTTNQACCVLSEPNNFITKFGFYWFMGAKSLIVSMSYGGGQPNISQDLIKSLRLPIPPLSEQTRIAEFLDTKTALIDKAIGIKEKQIELLKERRQIMIHRAVTRGIDPNVTLKPSGVEWIGDIPEHWEVKKLKYVLNINNGSDYKHIQTDSGYPVIGSGGQFAFASNYIFDGEVVLLGRKGTIDKPLYFKGKFWAVDTMFYANSKSNDNVKYMYYVTTTIPFKFYSTSTALPSMTQSDLNNHKFALPPLEEQKQIVTHIETLSSKIATAISLKEQEIEKLKEYKSVLINSAVTGKIKVG